METTAVWRTPSLHCLTLLSVLLVVIPAAMATSICPTGATPPNLSVLTEPEGMIALPQYSDNNNCTWTVQCPAGSVFTVTNLTMNTEPSYDYLSFGYCLLADSRRFSGVKVATGLVSNTSTLQVQFLSDSSVVRTGFWLHYRCVRPTCGEVQSWPPVVNCSQPIPCDPSFNGITSTELLIVNNYFCIADSYARTVQVIHNSSRDRILRYDAWRSSPANAVMATIPGGGETVYYTAASVSDYSFLLEYQCSRHTCDSANGSNVVFSGMRGQLISDSDGVGPTPMNNDDFCVWHIQCPADSTVYFPKIFLNAAYGYTYLKVYNDSADAAAAVLQSYTGYINSYGGFETNAVKLVFSSADRVQGANQYGLTLRWACRIGHCISPNATGAVFTGPSGRILSAYDGPGVAAIVPNGENCSWTVNCLDTESFMVTSMTYETAYSWDFIRIYNAENGMLLNQYSGSSASSSSELMNASSVRITYTTVYAGYTGFVLDYQCVPRSCAPAAADATLQNCTFTLPWSCTGGELQVVQMTFLGASKRVNTKLYLLGDGVQRIVYAAIGAPSGVATFQANTVAVSFVTPYASGAQDNFILRFHSCQTSHCLALNASGHSFSETSGHLEKLSHTNSDGVAQSCFWSITCPSPAQRILLDFRTYIYWSATLYFSATSGTTLNTYYYSTSRTNLLTDQNALNIRYTEPVPSTYANGQSFYDYNTFRIDWRCVTGNCSSVNATGIFFNDTAGRIVSGAEGISSYRYTLPKEDCTWYVQCPVGYRFTVSSLNMSQTSVSGPPQMTLSIVDAVNTDILLAQYFSGISNRGLVTNSTAVMIQFLTQRR
jgi:hypothetical protein